MPTKRQPDLTRQKLLEVAFEEIHRSGFRSASLDAILKKSGMTKGALYHHFKNKRELGYAVVDEMIAPLVETRWKAALEALDPLEGAIQLARLHQAVYADEVLENGCPFNNLCQEMSSIDEGFRQRLANILARWEAGIVQNIQRGKVSGIVRQDIDEYAAASFIVSSIEGMVGMAKAAQDREFLERAMTGLIDYTKAMRA